MFAQLFFGKLFRVTKTIEEFCRWYDVEALVVVNPELGPVRLPTQYFQHVPGLVVYSCWFFGCFISPIFVQDFQGVRPSNGLRFSRSLSCDDGLCEGRGSILISFVLLWGEASPAWCLPSCRRSVGLVACSWCCTLQDICTSNHGTMK